MSDAANASRPAPTHPPLGLPSVALVLVINACWGMNAVAARFALDAVPPVAAAGIRFALATLFMLVWVRVERSGLWLRRGQVGPAVGLGLLLFVQIGTFNVGVRLSNASHGALLINTAVFWVLVIEHFVTRTDRLTGRKVVGVLVAFSGTFLLLTRSEGVRAGNPDNPSLAGDLVLTFSAAVLGVLIVYTRHCLRKVEPGKLILWHDAVATAGFAVWSAALETTDPARIDTAAALALLYQGLVVGGFCFAAQAKLLQKHSGSQIAVFGFVTPLFGVGLASLLRSDPMSPWLLVAVACVAVGIVLVQRRG